MKILNPTFSYSSLGHIGKLVWEAQAFAGVGFSVAHASYYKLVYFINMKSFRLSKGVAMSASALVVYGIIVSFIIPILGVVLFIAAFVRGIVELKNSKDEPGKKKGWAIAAIVIGGTCLLLIAVSAFMLY